MGGYGDGFGYDRGFAHVTPLPFEQLEVPKMGHRAPA
jgi:hypothetical protein